MAGTKPFQISGACASVAQNVFKIKFSQPLSAVPNLRTYDNSNTYPNTSNDTTTAFTIFSGSASNSNYPMIIMIDTTRGGPPSSAWWQNATLYAGKATVFQKGNDSYLQFRYSAASMTPANGGSVLYNALIRTPNDVNPTMTRLHNVVIRYQYTSTIPTVYFYANSIRDGGTEASPSWATINSGTSGVKFGSSTATSSGPLANIPLTGQEITKTAWVTES